MTTFTGTTGPDTFTGFKAGDTADGLAGQDTISVDFSTATAAIVYNAITAATAAGITPLPGTTIRNVEHIDDLKTGAGADSLAVSIAQGAFTWEAGGGADRLVLNYQSATAGFDAYMSGGGYYVSATGGSATAIEAVSVTGGSGDDSISGTAGKDVLTGGGGDDALDGLKGVSQLDGGAGFDTVSLDLSSASLAIIYDGVAAETTTGVTLADGSTIKNAEGLGELDTGSGNDILTVTIEQGDFTWQAGSGNNRLVADYSGGSAALSAYVSGTSYYLSSTGATSYGVASVAITGGSAGDSLTGTAGNDTLNGGGGDDTLDGLTGISQIDGGAGTDTVSLDLSAATAGIAYDAIAAMTTTGIVLADGSTVRNAEHLAELDTGSGNDTLTISKAQGGVIWQAGEGDGDRLVADYSAETAGFDAYYNNDYYYLTDTGAIAYDVESVSITGGSGGDDITGTAGGDMLNGGGGNDTLDGKAGISQIDGGAGSDTVSLDLSQAAVNIVYDAAAAAAVAGITLGDGSSVKNTEHIGELDTGSGDDTLSVKYAQGNFTWNAHDGADHLNLDYSAATTGFDAYHAGNYYYLANTGATAYDIESVTVVGGSGADAIGGTDGNDDLTGGGGDDDLDGGAGSSDTAGYRNAAAAVTVSLALQGAAQNTVGAGHDTLNGFENLAGSAYADTLTGDNRANILNGGSGADAMTGGQGDDTYYVDNSGDAVTEIAGEGTDTVSSSIGFAAGSQDIENIILTGTRDANAYGNALANSLTGNSGNNLLNGGADADHMAGGLGNDTYIVDNSADSVVEQADGGTDLVQSYVTFTLGANVENLDLLGGKAVNGTGNGLANIIHGNAANNALNGAAGADSLYGGAGNDTYYVDSFNDVVSEQTTPGTDDGGVDLIVASVNAILSLYVENLTLTGSAVSGTGNGLANVLTGDAAGNLLNGMTGGDTMYGAAGNDTYVVDNGNDVVSEQSAPGIDAGGTDLVQAGVSYALGVFVENLTLTGTLGFSATGNNLANILIGNGGGNHIQGLDGNDTMRGLGGSDLLDGGTGGDIMVGGAGDDTYIVDDAGDRVSEQTVLGTDDGGTDTVQSSVAWALGGFLENLTLTGSVAINGTGNAVGNIMVGNSAVNVLTGQAGNDTLTGGGGGDVFVFGPGSGGDIITDFSTADNDRINVHAYASAAHTVSEVNGNAVIDFGGGNQITVIGASSADPVFLNHIVW